ncbi:GH36-type glycosyl hydrolase domain-containing protein [Asticcacaulis tiandongensis]|uniref:GH36-type glycosyl hydrolase domain-containing protein n=1 Tax=Asticcacaulis tiandongensis TaxID=2565365 RepID=UPI001128C692|nr:glycosyltransferase 36 [Asticcacaulis tiandongensis]
MSLITFKDGVCTLRSPTALPRASGFLWNRKMMLHASARGYVTAMFMQPEPARYAHAPVIQAKTFILPEQAYFAHHPGRFVYVKDRDTGEVFSLPHEPVRQTPDRFAFTQTPHDLTWETEKDGLAGRLNLRLPVDEVVELWSLGLENRSGRTRHLSLFVYFPLGFMSWMNQSAKYEPELGGIVGTCVTPYQKVADYFKNKDFKDKTFLLSAVTPDGFEARQEVFEGEGGLMNPDGVREGLRGGVAVYETPACILEFEVTLADGEAFDNRLLFGPAKDEAEIAAVRERWFADGAFEQAEADYKAYLAEGAGVLSIETPDAHLDEFVNHWLARQVYYHGDTNRLTTDPQTRNFVQDAMGMVYVQPEKARDAFLYALSQQHEDGAMPDGIKLYAEAEFSYINQVPHTDHCVWLFMWCEAYLSETGDYALLDVVVEGRKVRDRLEAALIHLWVTRDERGLSFIDQGDWNDPMNMVGYKGRGVSGWLSVAVAYACDLWAKIVGEGQWALRADEINRAVNSHLWDGDWFARGITDDGTAFGVKTDAEGAIYLNPQSFALLSGAADRAQTDKILAAVESRLETPYGVEMLGAPYTAMREDVGRLTQKSAGAAENGSVYNHAAAFYIYSLYQTGHIDKGFDILRRMLTGPGEADYLQRGQIPVFVPNYYRGAFREHPQTAGRSSQLFNTGTAAWVYRIVIEELFGLKGTAEGLQIRPNLPAHWPEARVKRQFRGVTYDIHIRRGDRPSLRVDGVSLDGDILPVRDCRVEVEVV